MKAALLAVAVLATIAISSAVDEECMQRKVRGLPIHWPNPTDCSSFYRCTNKNVRRELLCPAGKEYNPKTGRCANLGKNLCKLSLKAPIAGSTNPCAGAVSGSFVAEEGSCRSFNICNNNLAYPQTCDAGSYFNTTTSACQPDTEISCWENLCVLQANGVYLANDNDCHSFYICADKEAVAQECPSGSYFNKETKNCQPGECPSDITTPTPITTTCTDEITTPFTTTCTDEVTTPTTTCTDEITIPSTTTCTDEITTPSTTTCTDEITTPSTTTCTDEITTPSTTTCTDEITTPSTTTCTDEITTPSTTTCTDEVTTPTTTCTDEITTPSTTTCTDEVTTPTTTCTDEIPTPSTTTCTEDVTTPTTTCTDEIPTPSTEACTDEVPACVSDINCDCTNCLNAADNIVYPALNTNTGFCMCSNKKPVYRQCPDGSIFEVSVNVCVAQDKVCPSNNCLNQPNYTLFPAANTTKGYCVCLDNEAKYENCPETDYVFDTELRFCVKSPSDDCEEDTSTSAPVLCEGGFSEGDFVPNPYNCMLFYICFDGELVETSCETGNYYDAKTKECLPDTEGVCPQCTEAVQQSNRRNKRSIKAATCTVDGVFSPVPLECYKYYVCVQGEQIVQECIEGSYFNANTLRCEVDTQNVCRPKAECSCPGGYENGQFSPHPTDLDKYYICNDGTQVIQECGLNYCYDPDTQACEADVNNKCWPTTECTCPGGYQEGQFSPHPNPLDCNKYYICTDGTQVLHECGLNNYFNKEKLQCEIDTDNVCVIDTNCTCPGGYQEGQFSPHPNPLSCDKYYVCSGGTQILQECGTDEFFNKTSQECELDKTHVCWPNQCAGQVNGAMVANPKQCYAYYICQDQEQTPDTCAEGQWFDASKSSCQPDVNAVCFNPCANDQTINLLPHPDCTKYYFCNGPQTIVGTCQVGGFNATMGVCSASVICPGNECVGKYDNYAFADPDDNTKFYVCLSGVPVLKDCPPNHAYNPVIAGGLCLPISNPDCDPTPCLDASYNQAYSTLNGSIDEFCYCKNSMALKNQCQDDMVFNNAIGACYSNAPCDPTICPNSPDYTVAPNRNDTGSFCLCVSQTAVIVECPFNETFNPFSLLCSNVEISSQCSQYECITQENNYKFDALTASDNGFCLCKDHIATFIPCAEGSTYNPTIGICLLTDINCDAKQCQGLADNTKIPALTTSQGYCECVADKATYVNCPDKGEFDVTAQECLIPVCNPDECASLNNYESFPASNTTFGFCVCINNEAQYRDCPYDQAFNTAVGVCTALLINCEDSMCNGLADGTNLPALYTTNGFCSCLAGLATFEKCATDQVFNTDKKMCMIDVEALCGPSTYCDTCNPTFSCSSYAATNSVTGFCYCGASGPQFEECEPGYIFNGQVCHQTAESNCDITACASATLDNPLTSPALNGNSSFCYCAGPDDVMLLNCPAGEYYNDVLKLCTNVIEESCSCPNGILNGEIVSDTDTCNKYFQCLDGVMHEQVCAAGQYFDDYTKTCCVDTEGVCSNKSECTCLGAYHEGERLDHPVNAQMYYVCQNSRLLERDCGVGRIFNKLMNQCIKAPRFPHKRSVDNDHEVRTVKKISTFFTKFLF